MSATAIAFSKGIALFACCVVAAATCAGISLGAALVLGEIAHDYPRVFLAGAACASLWVFLRYAFWREREFN